jgi:hypothetical protein
MYPTMLPWIGGPSEVESALDGAGFWAGAFDCAPPSAALSGSLGVAGALLLRAATSADTSAISVVVEPLSAFPAMAWAKSETGNVAASRRSTRARLYFIDKGVKEAPLRLA